MNRKLVSVLIPTRNRQKYAWETVRQILSIPDEGIEVIVQDNSDNEELKEKLSGIRDNRLIYNYEEKRLSGVDNFEHASRLAGGEYLCAIGDDDGILSTVIPCAQWMKRKKIDIVKPALCVYHWPLRTEDKILKKRQGTLKIRTYTRKYRELNTKDGIRDVLRHAGMYYRKYDIAGSYHGLISRQCMDKIRKKAGACFGGLSPDIYNAVCLSLLDNIKAVETDYPVTISGICGASTSAMSAAGKHVGRLEDAPHLAGIQNYEWDERVMRFYSVETIWAETMMKAVSDMGYGKAADKWFDSGRLTRLVIKNNYTYRRYIYEQVLGNVDITDKMGYALAQVQKKIREYLSAVNVCQREIRKIDTVYKEIMNIMEAYRICEKELKKMGIG